MIILLSIIEWVLVIIFFITFLLLVLWVWSGLSSKVPFIPVPQKILKDIRKALNVKEGSVVYDLGCGDGRILFYLSKIIPSATYIGIEHSPFPLLLAHSRSWWQRKAKTTKIQIINQDFFNHDLSNATHIFAYLYPNVMDDLLPKFDRELKSGTRVVSLSFKFTGKQPIQEIDLGRSKYKIARMLYVYEF